MKKAFILILTAAAVLFLAACGSGSGDNIDSGIQGSKTTRDVLEEGMDKEDAKEPDGESNTSSAGESADVNEESGKETETAAGDENQAEESESDPDDALSEYKVYSEEDVELDLTKMSSTMVYSEALNMLKDAKSYEGRIVKMTGQISSIQTKKSLVTSCIVKDAAQCCKQGIPFIAADELVYPDDYPEIGTYVTIIGEFQPYDYHGVMSGRLIHASMAVAE
ncbi:MAG: hypothetical protein ACOX71_02905 [Lachnospiraceae bacterium]|jgi:hypothetical protein